MKPIRIFTHAACEPPGHIQTLVDRLQYANEQVCLTEGKSVPMELDNVAGLVFMGGPGDVNEPTDWMLQEMELIRRAKHQGVPVLGVCLGAQLMSKALGGKVWQANGLEVGWHEVELLPESRHHPWFQGLPERFTAFQWHAHSFAPPAGTNPVATSECTQCQAYVDGPNLALQFHLEMTEQIICSLLDKYAEDLVGASPCVQTSEEIRNDIRRKCEDTFAIADLLLERWFHSAMAC